MKQNSRNLSFPINNCPPASADTIGMGIVNLDLILDVFCDAVVLLVVGGREREGGMKVERWRNRGVLRSWAPATATAHEQVSVELG